MYTTVHILILVSRAFNVELPAEMIQYIIRLAVSAPLFKFDLIEKVALRQQLLDKSEEQLVGGEGDAIGGRILSMKRAIHIAIIEMGLSCHPVSKWNALMCDCDVPMSTEEALSNPEKIWSTELCILTDEQRNSQISYDLKVLTIDFMRKLVETPRFVRVDNLINFDGKWIEFHYTYDFGTRKWPTYIVESFKVFAQEYEWENMYPNLYGKDGWCSEHHNEKK